MARQVHRWNPRALLLQLAVAIGIAAGLVWLLTTTQHNLTRLGVQSGFDFLAEKAGFSLPQTLIPYTEESTMGRAIEVAALNTALVVAATILLSSILGLLVALARISRNAPMALLGTTYVEIFRNIPVLLQIFFWYFVVLRSLPGFADSLHIGSAILNNRGLYLPWISFDPFSIAPPTAGAFNYEGSFHLLPEFLALWIGLALYNASYIAEIVRSGILSVPPGQGDAAAALGLTRAQALRWIVLPLAMRVIIPPLTTVYLNIFKSSSLAAAIAYPDLVSVLVGTINNLTGQPVEVMAITLVFFVSVSLAISFLMNRYNRRVQLEE